MHQSNVTRFTLVRFPSVWSWFPIWHSFVLFHIFNQSISKKYVDKYLGDEVRSIWLERHGQKWQLTLGRKPQNSRVAGGWAKFVRDNELETGDICLFELLKHCKLCAVKVHIIRAKNVSWSTFYLYWLLWWWFRCCSSLGLCLCSLLVRCCTMMQSITETYFFCSWISNASRDDISVELASLLSSRCTPRFRLVTEQRS